MAEFSVTQIGEGEEREYAVVRDGDPCLQVALTPTTYAIGWPGTTIENFDRTVRREVPRHAGIAPPASLAVRVITQDPREYRQFSLPKDSPLYRDIIGRMDRVSFIRYDNHLYSFTAAHPSHEPELAIRLDRAVALNNNLILWILKHHRNGDMLANDFESLFRSIE